MAIAELTATQGRDAAASPTATGRPRIATTHLFLVMAAVSVGVSWYYANFVMTREVYHNLLGAQLETDRIDQFFDLLRRRTSWSLAVVPLFLLVRVGFIALIAQLVLLLWAVEVRVSLLFRAALWAYLAPLVESVSRVVALGRLDPSEIDASTLTANPGSLAYWLASDDRTGTLALVLSPFTLTEVGWVLIMAVAIHHAARVTPARSVAVTGAIWTLIALVQVTLSLYFVRL